MLRKLPAALLVVSVLMTIPTLASWIRPEPAAAIVLSPGTADVGVRSTEERVEFWLDRIDTEADHLNRVRAGTALLELARQTGAPSDLAAALDMAEAALDANPSSLDARIVRAAALNSDHRFDEALVEIELVLDRRPESFRAHAIAGDAQLELGHHDIARRHYDRLSTLQPGSPAVLSRRAELAWDTDDPDAAIELGTRALRQANTAGLPAGELSFYAIRLARMRLDAGDPDDALELAQAALAIAPHVPAVHSTLGLIHQAEGRIDLAIGAYERAIAITPLPEAVAGLAELAS